MADDYEDYKQRQNNLAILGNKNIFTPRRTSSGAGKRPSTPMPRSLGDTAPTGARGPSISSPTLLPGEQEQLAREATPSISSPNLSNAEHRELGQERILGGINQAGVGLGQMAAQVGPAVSNMQRWGMLPTGKDISGAAANLNMPFVSDHNLRYPSAPGQNVNDKGLASVPRQRAVDFDGINPQELGPQYAADFSTEPERFRASQGEHRNAITPPSNTSPYGPQLTDEFGRPPPTPNVGPPAPTPAQAAAAPAGPVSQPEMGIVRDAQGNVTLQNPSAAGGVGGLTTDAPEQQAGRTDADLMAAMQRGTAAAQPDLMSSGAGANYHGVLPDGRYDYTQDQGMQRTLAQADQRSVRERDMIAQNDARSAIAIAQAQLADPKYRSKSQNYTAAQRRGLAAERKGQESQIEQGRKALEDIETAKVQRGTDAAGLEEARIKGEADRDVASITGAAARNAAGLKAAGTAASKAAEQAVKDEDRRKENFNEVATDAIRQTMGEPKFNEEKYQFEERLENRVSGVRNSLRRDLSAIEAIDPTMASNEKIATAATNFALMRDEMNQLVQDETGPALLGMENQFLGGKNSAAMVNNLLGMSDNWHGSDKNLWVATANGGTEPLDWSDVPARTKGIIGDLKSEKNNATKEYLIYVAGGPGSDGAKKMQELFAQFAAGGRRKRTK